MRVADLGEFGLIGLLAREFGLAYPPAPDARPRASLLVDLGDDAVVTQPRDAATIWTTDTMVAGVHFLPEATSWHDVGWKAMAVNLSDIAAMGGQPYMALITLCLPADFLVDDAIDFYRGLHEAAGKFQVMLGGGDIVRSPVFASTIALSGWARGSADGPVVMTRSAAQVGDVVAVSGLLGDSAGGLRLIRDQTQTNSGAERHLRIVHQRPQPRVELGRTALEAGVRCGMDVSDGLMQDLGHIASASNVGIRVDGHRVPVSPELQEAFPDEALALALAGGEDYELILIGPRPVIEALLAQEPLLTEIGEVVEAATPGVTAVDETGGEIPMPSGGWDHFAAS